MYNLMGMCNTSGCSNKNKVILVAENQDGEDSNVVCNCKKCGENLDAYFQLKDDTRVDSQYDIIFCP